MKSLYFDKNTKELVFLDRSALPEAEKYRRISTFREFFASLADHSLCGSDAVGAAAAYVLCAAAHRFEDVTAEGFAYSFEKSIDFLMLQCALYPSVKASAEKMRCSCGGCVTASDMLANIEKKAYDIEREIISYRRRLGEKGAKLISDGDGVLVRGNCGLLGGVKYGASLAAAYKAYAKNVNFRLFIAETYPSFDGKRLAAYEAKASGPEFEIVSDNDTAVLMAEKKINKIFLDAGATEYGKFCSEKGSLMLASSAKCFGVPVYAFLPYFHSAENAGKRDIIESELLASVVTGDGMKRVKK